MSKENEVFTDDLVERLRKSTAFYHADCELKMACAARIEELEAKLAKAVEALQSITFECVGDSARCGSRAALAMLKGQDNGR